MNSQKIIEITARWYAAAMIGLYAIGKLANGQFYRKGFLPPEVAQKTVEQLSAFELAWTFFGYSKTYIWFIGLSQLMGALLLLWPRTKMLGVAILLPILLNIIVVDAEFGVGDAIMSAIFYFLLLVLILVLNRKKIIEVWMALTTIDKDTSTATLGPVLRIALILALLVVTFFLETAMLKMAGFNRF